MCYYGRYVLVIGIFKVFPCPTPMLDSMKQTMKIQFQSKTKCYGVNVKQWENKQIITWSSVCSSQDNESGLAVFNPAWRDSAN